MSLTAERTAPPSPDHRPSDAELNRIVFGEPEDGPDEIAYDGGFVTTRADREKAARIWHEEGQVPHPDNAAESLARTQAMLRLRIKNINPQEATAAVSDQMAFTNARLQQIEDRRIAQEEARTGTPAWATDATGDFPNDAQPAPKQPAAGNKEYVGAHRAPETEAPRRSRRMRFPLHRLVRHAYKPRHSHK